MVRIAIPREFFIPVRLHPLRDGLKEYSGASPESWNLFCELIEDIFHPQSQNFRKKSKLDFHALDPYTAGGRKQPSRSTSDATSAEDRFLESFCQAMQKANYNILSRENWRVGLEYHFEFPVEVVCTWDKLESSPISRYLQKHELETSVFEHARHVLLFHRGVGHASISRRFMSDKINLFLRHLAHGVLDCLSKLRHLAHGVLDCLSKSQADLANGAHKSEVESDDVEYLERETLSHVLPTVFSVIRNFPKVTTIREPTFKDVVLVYFEKQKNRNSLIQLKSFQKIPMADIEVVFPHKKVSTQPKQKLQLLVAAVMTLVSVAKAYVSASTGWAMMCVIAIMCYKTWQMFWKMRSMKSTMLAKLSQSLHSNSRDEGLGVIHRLADSMEEQDVKETLLAYCTLLHHGPLDARDIRKQVEDYMQREFETAISFAVGDALSKLVELELASAPTDPLKDCRYKALPLGSAIQKLVSQRKLFLENALMNLMVTSWR